MSKTRLVITAVVTENRPVREVAVEYGVSRSWLYELLARYQREGEAIFEPRSRRPKTTPTAIPPEAIELIVELREKLVATGLDAGPDGHDPVASRARPRRHGVAGTISRYLTKAGLVVPE